MTGVGATALRTKTLSTTAAIQTVTAVVRERFPDIAAITGVKFSRDGGANWTASLPLDTANSVTGVADGSDLRIEFQLAADAAGNAWTSKANLNTARYYLAGAATSDDRVWSFGGNTGAVSAVTEQYVPANNAWTAKANLNTAREGPAGAATSDDRVWSFGGYTGAASLVTEQYVPANRAGILGYALEWTT